MAGEDVPVLVVVDDAPWVDAASLEALQFAARRLDADRVGFLFAARDELAAPFAKRFDSLPVGGLDTTEAVELVNEFAPLSGRGAGRAQARRGRPRRSVVAAGGGARALSGPAVGCGAADGPVPCTGERARAIRATRAESARPGAARPSPCFAADEQAPAPVMQQGAHRSRNRRGGPSSTADSCRWRPAGRASHIHLRGPPHSRSPTRHSGGWHTRRSQGRGTTPASLSARPGTGPRAATGLTRTSRPRSPPSHGLPGPAAHREPLPPRGSGRSRRRLTRTRRCRCGWSGPAISHRRGALPRRSPNSTNPRPWRPAAGLRADADDLSRPAVDLSGPRSGRPLANWKRWRRADP